MPGRTGLCISYAPDLLCLSRITNVTYIIRKVILVPQIFFPFFWKICTYVKISHMHNDEQFVHSTRTILSSLYINVIHEVSVIFNFCFYLKA